MNIAERLKELRIEAGVTQKELATSTGIALQSTINYENDRREPNSKAMVALERYFNVSGEYLRGESDQVVKPVVLSPDLLENVRGDLPKRMKELGSLLEKGGDAEAELAYHLVNELVHIFKMDDCAQRSTAVDIPRHSCGKCFLLGCL